jgi:AmiR/NasT family two-component response regulator
VVEWVVGCVTTVVLEDVVFETLERHALEEAGGHDPVGVDVMAVEGNPTADDLPPDVMLVHYSDPRRSMTFPVLAASTALANTV